MGFENGCSFLVFQTQSSVRSAPTAAGRRDHAGTYNIFIHELSEVGEASLLRQRVGVVSVLVHHAVGLQCSGTLQEDRGQLLQTVLCSEMEQRGKFLITLI